MLVISGVIRNGRVELDDNDVPDGTTVVVLVHEPDGTLKFGPADEAKLIAAVEQVRKKNRS